MCSLSGSAQLLIGVFQGLTTPPTTTTDRPPADGTSSSYNMRFDVFIFDRIMVIVSFITTTMKKPQIPLLSHFCSQFYYTDS